MMSTHVSSSTGKREKGTGKIALLFTGLFLIVFFCTFGHAQESLDVFPTGRAGEEPKPLPKELTPPTPPIQISPPVPSEEKVKQLPIERIFIRQIRITGNTAFPTEELAVVTAPYINRELTAEDLESLRLALTNYYISKGYINSGAIIPDQTVTDGTITLHIIEGTLSQIEVEGNKYFRTSFIQNRLFLAAKPPLNVYKLQERLVLLQEDERIQRLNAELRPGIKHGDSILKVRVQEENPFKIWFDFNNYQSPTVGAERWLATIADMNLTGNGDILSFTYGGSLGVKPQIYATYTLPLNVYDTTLTLHYEKNTFIVVESPFEDLDIESKSDIYEITLKHPFYRTPHHEFSLAFSASHLHDETFLLGEPFSFSPGTVEGESNVTAMRFSQEWVYRAPAQVIAAYSRFSIGIDALNATVNPPGIPDTHFFSWLFQFQWAKRFEKLLDMQTIFRFDLQLANDPLLPLEQIAVGGRYSVRGYRENQLVRDNGLIASLEARIPVIHNTPWADIVQLAPFVDFGRAWNTELPTPSPKTIESVGLGIRWEATWKHPFRLNPQFEIYWGIPLKKIDSPGNNLQDDGIHFRFLIAAF